MEAKKMINLPSEFPMIETQRLKLIGMSLEQGQDLYEMRHDPEHHKYTDTLPDESIEDTYKYVEKMIKGVEEKRWLIWAIALKESGENTSNKTGEIVGTISLWQFDEDKRNAELGFGLKANQQGKGYMKEALEAVLNYGWKSLHLAEILAYTEDQNLDSIYLLEKMGFEQSDCVTENGYLVDKCFKMRVYRIIPVGEADS